MVRKHVMERDTRYQEELVWLLRYWDGITAQSSSFVFSLVVGGHRRRSSYCYDH